MKTRHYLFLIVALLCLNACDNDDPSDDGVLWCPSLYESLIGDGSVTLRWTNYDTVDTKCFVINYVPPTQLEIYQSDNPNTDFVRIAELKNQQGEMSYRVDNLPNGKPVYFRVRSLRKNYADGESRTCMFIPNAQPATRVVFQGETSSETYYEAYPSPNGQQVVVVSLGENRSLYLYKADGSGKQRLAENVYKPAWANANTLTYITDMHNPNGKIQAYDCETGKTTVLKEGTQDYDDYALSPDGSKLLYTVYENGSNLYVHLVESGRDSLLRSRAITQVEYTEPLWLDNDTYLVKKDQATNPYTVSLNRITYADNKEEKLIADYHHYSFYATPSPDGKQIAYVDMQNDTPILMLYHTESGERRQLSGYDAYKIINYQTRHLCWKDNQTLYYTEYTYNDPTPRVLSVSIP